MTPLFSIITVTYNAAETLPVTLASVSEQTCRLFEYIVMDGVSTDETLRLVNDAAIPESRVFSSPDNGLYDAPGIVYGQTDIVDVDRHKLCPRHLQAPETLTLQSFANGMVVCHQAFCALRKLTGEFDTRYRFSADYDWCINCLQRSRRNVYIPEVVIDYLNEGTTTRNRRKSLMERFRIMCHYYGTLPTVLRHLKFIPRFIRQSRKERVSKSI